MPGLRPGMGEVEGQHMTTVVVVDTETTGLGEADQVVEVAAVWVPRRFGGDSGYSVLVRPTCPVSLEARAVHHITDVELGDAPTMAALLAGPTGPGLIDADVMACHNLEFDLRMLLQSGVPRAALPARAVCTWRCALHLYPDAPGHSNQILRYYLGVEVPPCDGPPHRALPDACVTAAVLGRMLEGHTVEGLEALTQQPALLARVPFGRSRGRPWGEMDRGFLEWVLSPRQDFNADVRHTARHWLERRSGVVM